MKAADSDHYELVKRNEERLLKGETKNSIGRPITLAEEDALVELDPGDHFLKDLALELEAAIPPDGTFPDPQGEERILERMGIMHPENRNLVHDTSAWCWAGRAKGLNTEFKKS